MELTDGTIRLRPLTPSDVPRIVEACNDPDVARFIPGIPCPYTEADGHAYVSLMLDPSEAGQGRIARAIVGSGSDVLLGSIDVRVGETGSIGYWVHPEDRGEGVATRALLLLSRWAVQTGGVQRLELTTHPENEASRRVAEKAGFVREGVLRSHIAFREGRRDSVMFSLLPADLES
jgi:RimJ/RimL family protein N-acetyltransferase